MRGRAATDADVEDSVIRRGGADKGSLALGYYNGVEQDNLEKIGAGPRSTAKTIEGGLISKWLDKKCPRLSSRW